MLLEGVFLPLTTPFYPDGRLYLRKMEHNAERYSKTPAAGLVVLGETGEPTLLGGEETRQALRSAIDAAAAEKVMIAGVSRDSVAETLELAEFAAGCGYDAVIAAVPRFLREGAGEREWKQILAYFQVLADRSPLPLVLASGRAGARIPEDTATVLAQHSGVAGVVEMEAARVGGWKRAGENAKREITVTTVFTAVTGRMLARTAEAEAGSGSGSGLVSIGGVGGGAAVAERTVAPALKTRTKTVGLQVLGGDSREMLASLREGAVGVVPGFGACSPQACYEVAAAWKDGDAALAEEKQLRVSDAAKRIVEEIGVAGVKYACDLNGYYGGRPRLPLLPVTGEERAEIEGLMRGMRN